MPIPRLPPEWTPGRDVFESYHRGLRHLQVDAIHGQTGIVGDANIGGDLLLGDRVNVFVGGQRHGATPGPVRAEFLEWLRARYVPVDGYDQILELLRERRLVMVRGPAGTGRTTTALRLLDEVTNGKVARLDTAVDLRTIEANDFTEGSGYLGELPDEGTERTLGEMHLDRLSDLLGNIKCFCVPLAEHDPRNQDSLGSRSSSG